jgi:outer membrane protein OmpA-like peptidoglycan-associated protein
MNMDKCVGRAAGLLAALALAAGGCTSWGRTEKEDDIAAAGDTAAGAVVGPRTGSTVYEALIGAMVRGSAGADIGHHMDEQAEKLTGGLPGAKVSRIGEGIAVTFESDSLFPPGSSEPRPDGRDALRRLGESLQEDRHTEVLVVGHTDATGAAAENQAVSESRARAVADFLAAQGVPRERLRAEGRGETEPIAPNDTEIERRSNRRVEIAIYADAQSRAQARRPAGSD